MTKPAILDGSFRDPAGQVHELGGRIFRTVTQYGASAFSKVHATGFLTALADAGDLVPYEIVHDPEITKLFPHAEYVLEHKRLDYISYPYEWPFSLLKEAALLHLSIAIQALEKDIVLTDASAYNVQFVSSKPIFIDHLSFKPYTDREYWVGHRQFCEQFLNPLLLRAKLDIPHNSWFRGAQEGITNEDLSKILRLRHKFSLNILSHVVLPARFQTRARNTQLSGTKKISERKGIAKATYKSLLVQLKKWISTLQPKNMNNSTWGSYAEDNTYDDNENKLKAEFITEFIQSTKPELIYDIGCNSGAFSEVALKAGAHQSIGFDFDKIAIEKAFKRATDKSLNLLPLYLDAANPSPNQGWQQSERVGFAERASPDAILALAFEHHLAIGKNIPLPQVINWLVSLAPNGIIEFVDKSDPTVQAMLSMREDIFPHYTQSSFESALSDCAAIVKTNEITKNGRTLYWYKRV
ncbi:class I SAM-dependent methyltransferase [Kiloniella majae]|uniref:class I SAM-dependent methyltransferase n=1 Tax=Kiloniella majae TaxID=1938558 RepID=UPI000F784A61|nr:class I SAM-dependent methyltransferase [Kiloniella majae]